MLRELIKVIARGLATAIVVPLLVTMYVRSAFVGRDRAFEASTELLALVPGFTGQYLRRAFLERTIAGCHKSVVIRFGTVFSQTGARIEENVYIGPHCDLGLVHIERNAMIAAGVYIPSGPLTHGTGGASTPTRHQPGTLRIVRIGADAWIGNKAVVMADVGRGAIVGAGAVVTRLIPDRAIAVGVPARVVRNRDERDEPSLATARP